MYQGMRACEDQTDRGGDANLLLRLTASQPPLDVLQKVAKLLVGEFLRQDNRQPIHTALKPSANRFE